MLRLEKLHDNNDDERPRRVRREKVYFELYDCQYRQCFKFSKVQVLFILNCIGKHLTCKTNKNKAVGLNTKF